MSNKRNDHNREHRPAVVDRRKFLVTGLALAAASLLNRVATGAPAEPADEMIGENPVKGPAAQPMRIGVIGAGWLAALSAGFGCGPDTRCFSPPAILTSSSP